LLEADPWIAARQRAYVNAEALLVALPPPVPEVRRQLEAPVTRPALSSGAQPRPAIGKTTRTVLVAGDARPIQVAGKTRATLPARKILQAGAGAKALGSGSAARLRPLPGEASPATVGAAHGSARPVAFCKPKPGGISLVLEAVARWLPTFLPPTGARPS
jgi:hypothetical protein